MLDLLDEKPMPSTTARKRRYPEDSDESETEEVFKKRKHKIKAHQISSDNSFEGDNIPINPTKSKVCTYKLKVCIKYS